MSITVKGMFLKNLVETVKQKKGPEGLKKLEDKFGDLRFSGIKDYPVETEIKLQKAAMEVIFGKVSPDNYVEFGKLGFLTYANSLIGKTIFSLLGKDVKKIALGVPTAINTISSGFKITVTDLGAQKVSIRMINNPYITQYYEGVYKGAMEYLNVQGKIEVNVLREHDYEYILEWDKRI